MPRPRKPENLPANILNEIEGDWRAGVMLIRVIAAKYRVHPDALRNFATRAGWTRSDLGDAIRESANRALIDRTVADDQQARGDPDPVVATDKEVIQRYGQLAADVVGSHRKDAARGRLHAARLEGELYRVIKVMAAAEIKDPKQRLSLIRSAAETLRCVAHAMKTFVDIERQAWGLDKPGGGSAGYDEFLDELHGEQQSKLVDVGP